MFGSKPAALTHKEADVNINIIKQNLLSRLTVMQIFFCRIKKVSHLDFLWKIRIIICKDLRPPSVVFPWMLDYTDF